MQREKVTLIGVVVAIALSGWPRPVVAKVVEADAGGFQLKFELTLAAPPEKVFATLVNVGSWWNPEHTYSGNAANLHLDAKPGGCWCETLPDGGGIQHMTVVNLVPGKRLVLSGALGPLQSAGVAGSMSWKLTPGPTGTVLTLTYDVGGHFPGGLAAVAPAVDGVLDEQVHRLQLQVETGKPVAPSAPARH